MTETVFGGSDDARQSEAGRKPNTDKVPAETAVSVSDLGALKLDADEIAAFEKWMTGPTKPTDLMVKAAAHKVLRARQAR